MSLMQNGDPGLAGVIREQIRREGAVTFRWFMQQALYHPEHGYYGASKAAIGIRGDFYTSVSTGPVFGKLLAMQFEEMWERMGRPGKFTIVEQGANNGDFARDMLGSAGPEFFGAIDYAIVEPIPVLWEKQAKILAGFPQARWVAELEDLPPFRGVHFSNELVDAMPVHLVKYTAGSWKELHVNFEDGAFTFAEGPLSTGRLAHHLGKLPLVFPENYTTEINLDALEWIDKLAPKLDAGYVLIADYGYPRADFYSPERSTGTLACYSQHKRTYDPLENAGDADITAHVDFTSLAERAMEHGFRVAGFADQHHFLVGLGKRAFPDSNEAPDAARQKELRGFQTLMHPNLMGMNFKFLGLQKNVTGEKLAGFEYAPDTVAALGLQQ